MAEPGLNAAMRDEEMRTRVAEAHERRVEQERKWEKSFRAKGLDKELGKLGVEYARNVTEGFYDKVFDLCVHVAEITSVEFAVSMVARQIPAIASRTRRDQHDDSQASVDTAKWAAEAITDGAENRIKNTLLLRFASRYMEARADKVNATTKDTARKARKAVS